METSDPAARVHTSDCGSVAVRMGADSNLTVQLAATAVRMPARDLAELVTYTARDAADAARAAQSTKDSQLGSAADALAELKNLRDGIRVEGVEAVIERKRVELDAPEPDLPPDDPRTQSRLALGGSEFPTATLDMAIAMLERFQGASGPAGPLIQPDDTVGTATSPDNTVTVEATGEYPIARVLLGNHARELGPAALADEITETAARAAADLKERRRASIDAMGLPLTLDQVDGLPSEVQAFGEKSLGQAAYLRQDHDAIIRRLRDK